MAERGNTSPGPALEPSNGPDTPTDVGAIAQPPAWLSDEARSYWVDLHRHLPPAAISPAEAHAFAMLCNELATYADADALVQAAGVMITGTMGELAVNPALTIRNQASAAIQRWSTYLRITPVDRGVYDPKRNGGDNKLRHRAERPGAQVGTRA